MADRLRRGAARARGLVVLVAWAWLAVPAAEAWQVPGLPAATKPGPGEPKDDPTKNAIPAEGQPGAVFTATSGTISTDTHVDDEGIEETLNNLLPEYPGVQKVTVHSRNGRVTLDGLAHDETTISGVTAFAQKVEGVRLVLNKMKTDAEVLTGRERAMQVLREYKDVVARNWLLALLAAGFVALFVTLARLFGRYSETLMAPFFRNSLLRSVAGSIIQTLLFVAGIMIGLSILNLSNAVFSILGVAGAAGLALGFAFRDIAENFIASMLLGLRRPFSIGDFVTVAGRSGSVLSLDTRATTLITPEGNHVQIPNAVIYKETLINASITPSVLGSIEVLVPYEASTAQAVETIIEAMDSTEGLRAEPKPRVLVQALEVNGVRLKATYWMPVRGLDNDKLQSDLRLKIKVGFQQAGIAAPANQSSVSVSGPITVAVNRPEDRATRPGLPASPSSPGKAVRPGLLTPKNMQDNAAAIAEANLRRDSEAAANANAEPSEAEVTPIDHAIKKAEAEAEAEGGNLLVNARDKDQEKEKD